MVQIANPVRSTRHPISTRSIANLRTTEIDHRRKVVAITTITITTIITTTIMTKRTITRNMITKMAEKVTQINVAVTVTTRKIIGRTMTISSRVITKDGTDGIRAVIKIQNTQKAEKDSNRIVVRKLSQTTIMILVMLRGSQVQAVVRVAPPGSPVRLVRKDHRGDVVAVVVLRTQDDPSEM